MNSKIGECPTYKNVLLLSPHTDDIELGCGGTVSKLLENKCVIHWVVFTRPRTEVVNEFLEVTKMLGMNTYEILEFKIRDLQIHRQEILDKLISIKNVFNPELVICPSINDFHQDHQVIASETIRAFKTSSSIISYELPWNYITFNTQLFCKLRKYHVDQKWEFLRHYKTQMEKRYFDKEAIYGLARIRGVQCDSDYAEAFEVIRWIV